MATMQTVVMIVLLSLAGTSASDYNDTERFGDCPEGWERFGNGCYQFNNETLNKGKARDACTRQAANLLTIESEEENNFVEGMIRGRGSDVWLGISRGYYESWTWDSNTINEQSDHPSYNNWADSGSRWTNCAVIDSYSGYWRAKSDCGDTYLYVCLRTPNCALGWYGDRCESRCHCKDNDPCSIPHGYCPRGCQDGWGGRSCSEEFGEPKISYHCSRTKENALRAAVTVDLNNREFSVIQAVDAEGQYINCSVQDKWVKQIVHMALQRENAFSSASNRTFGNFADLAEMQNITEYQPYNEVSGNRTMPVSNSTAEPFCAGTQSENGSVTWYIQLKKYENVVTGDDIFVEVTCDPNAETTGELEMFDLIEDKSQTPTSVTAKNTALKTMAYLGDLYTQERVQHVSLGRYVRLHVNITGLSEVEYAHPHSCVAYAADNPTRRVTLIDKYGCGKWRAPVEDLFRVTKDHFVSTPFPTFSLGSEFMFINCEVEVAVNSANVTFDSTCNSLTRARYYD